MPNHTRVLVMSPWVFLNKHSCVLGWRYALLAKMNSNPEENQELQIFQIIAVTSWAKMLALGQSTSQTFIGGLSILVSLQGTVTWQKKILCRNTYWFKWSPGQNLFSGMTHDRARPGPVCMRNMKYIQISVISRTSYRQFKYGSTDFLFLSPGMKNIWSELGSCTLVEVQYWITRSMDFILTQSWPSL